MKKYLIPTTTMMVLQTRVQILAGSDGEIMIGFGSTTSSAGTAVIPD